MNKIFNNCRWYNMCSVNNLASERKPRNVTVVS